MKDQAEYYLKGAQKLLGKEKPGNKVPEVNESVEDMLRFLKGVQTFDDEPTDDQLFLLNRRLEGESSPTKLFAKEKYQSSGVVLEQNLTTLQQRLQLQSAKFRIGEQDRRKDHTQLNKQIISSINAFDQASNCKLPLDDINRQAQLFPGYMQTSIPTHIVHSTASFDLGQISRTFKLDTFQLSRKTVLAEIPDEIQIQMEETEETLIQKQTQSRSDMVTSMLRRHPRFTKMFGAYIKYFIKRQLHKDPEFVLVEDVATMVYQRRTSPPPPLQNVQVQQNRQFLGPVSKAELAFYVQNPERTLAQSQPLFQKVANKRVGETFKYHPKTFILTGEQLVYYGKDSNMKMVVVKPQILESSKADKEVGGFFSRQMGFTKVFRIKGQEKNIQIEYDQLEGSQIFKAMTEHFAIKAYQAYCLASETVQHQFSKFLSHSSPQIWDFTKMRVVASVQLYQYLPYWFACMPFKPSLKQISFRNCKMPPTTTQFILRNLLNTPLQHLRQLDISGNSLLEDGVRAYCRCLNKYPLVTKIMLYDCGLNSYYVELLANELLGFERELDMLDIGGNPLANVTKTHTNIISIIDSCHPRVFKINDGQFSGEDFVLVTNFRYDIVQLQASNCNFEVTDEVVKSLILSIQRNYKLKVIRAVGNKVTASNENLLQLMARPQLNEIALEFPPEFFTDIKNPDNQWVIVPL